MTLSKSRRDLGSANTRFWNGFSTQSTRHFAEVTPTPGGGPARSRQPIVFETSALVGYHPDLPRVGRSASVPGPIHLRGSRRRLHGTSRSHRYM
jgi:hypothetical protein